MGFRVTLLLVLAAARLVAAGAFDWQVKRFDGRDYVPFAKIGAFYKLAPAPAGEAGTSLLESGRESLLVTREIRQIRINGVNHWLSFPVIERDGQLWVSRMDLGKTIEPALRPAKIPGLRPFDTVVIDPGHGGHDKGASSTYELEKNFALDMSRRVRNELQKAGLKVIMTRNSDVFIELHQRAALANAKPNAIFVSLHFNSASNLQATGFEIFCVTPRGSPSTEYDNLTTRDLVEESGNSHELASFSLANAVYHSLHGSGLGMFDRGVKRARFAVLRLLKMPGILIEGGFLSNTHDARLIATKAWRDQYAAAIATGILEYRKLAVQKVPFRQVADYRHGTPAAVAALPTPTPAGAPTEKSN